MICAMACGETERCGLRDAESRFSKCYTFL